MVSNRVSNCSFAAGAGFQGGWSDISPVSNDFEGSGTFFGITPADGSNLVGFGDYPNNPGTLSQTLATTAGQEYVITFAIAQQGGGANSIQVKFGGATLATFTNFGNTTFAEFSYTATASSSSSVLSYLGSSYLGSSYNYFTYVDNISVAANVPAAPEPAAWVLMAGALLLFAGFRRMRPSDL